MRILFFGSGSFGLPTLQWLSEHHQLAAVISQPDKPAGRKRVLTPTPIAQWASEQGLPVHRVEDVNTEAFVGLIREYDAEASVVIAFGQKLGEPLIDAMGKLAVNLHASLLPAYRGAAPINWAMIDRCQTTGVSVIALAQRMDAGEVYATAELAIDPNETAGELHDRLANLGPDAIGRVLTDLENGTLDPKTQDESKATKARKFTKSDGTVDFNQPADAVRARIHGLTPWPGCKVLWLREGQEAMPVTLLRVESDASVAHETSPGTVIGEGQMTCNPGVIKVLELQRPGKRAMTLQEFTAGHPIEPGQRFEKIDPAKK